MSDIEPAADTPTPRAFGARWELYRLLADPMRVKILALCATTSLAVTDLALLLREQQPKISRHTAALRDADLLVATRYGTWTYLKLSPAGGADPVVMDAVRAGKQVCERDGTLARIETLLAEREDPTNEFFSKSGRTARVGPPAELAAYLAAVAPMIPDRRLAVDAGTGDGAMLEVLAPMFEHVVAFDASSQQLELAAQRVQRRDFANVRLLQARTGGANVAHEVRERSGDAGGADVVLMSRMLHHAAAPASALEKLAALARPPRGHKEGGLVCVIDYEAHEDQALRERQADLWLGFEPRELKRFAREANLDDAQVRKIPAAWQGDGPDKHLNWQILTARRGKKK